MLLSHRRAPGGHVDVCAHACEAFGYVDVAALDETCAEDLALSVGDQCRQQIRESGAQVGNLDLPPGEYYHYQLVGLAVVTEQGEELGTLQEVLVTGSNDVYVVQSEAGDEILLPAVSQVIKQVDLSAGRMLVHLIDGLR